MPILRRNPLFRLPLVIMLCFLTGCGGGITRSFTPASDPAEHMASPPATIAPKTVVLMLDGTGNDLNSVTNVGRLHHLVTLQNRRDLSVFYTSGVGADRTGPLGLATGLGFRKDVEAAYGFLSDHFDPETDKLHLYGYSRGAFAARALAGFVHSVGLLDLSQFDQPEDGYDPALTRQRRDFLSALFTAYKFPPGHLRQSVCRDRPERLRDICMRRAATAQVRKRWNVPLRAQYSDVGFDIVGLWDTVEVLGLSNADDNPDHVNPRYSDQICNMKKVLHAVSLDDTRATTYTPVLMTRNRLTRDCDDPGRYHFDKVEEVWFAGAHGDVGGSYPQGALGGVSLNWMLHETEGTGVAGRSIYPEGTEVYQHELDIVHDTERMNRGFQVLFYRNLRDLRRYLAKCKNDHPGSLCGSAVDSFAIHPSAVVRQQADEVISPDLRRTPSGRSPNVLSKGTENLASCIKALPERADNCPPLKIWTAD
ncbi:DUF2235 domain-containing protein [Roseovarius sp. A21]|uniref:DUF2235 domain-containing protein n=1 Tax=Roseovarius bejariae TaxID=2576383 RepID=A0A844CQ83_9RHOB|nr:DUF2235 domain-containing protein [Roseovarius bejariae]MRU16762.1 DUF2235 domain-containing protein [Roseovarius bejariae]